MAQKHNISSREARCPSGIGAHLVIVIKHCRIVNHLLRSFFSYKVAKEGMATDLDFIVALVLEKPTPNKIESTVIASSIHFKIEARTEAVQHSNTVVLLKVFTSTIKIERSDVQ